MSTKKAPPAGAPFVLPQLGDTGQEQCKSEPFVKNKGRVSSWRWYPAFFASGMVFRLMVWYTRLNKSEFGTGCTAMLRKLNCFLNIVIGSSIGVFIGFGIYKFWHFKTYPNLYAIQSAPWYTELLLDGALVAVVMVVCIILKLIIRKKSKP